MGWIILGHTFIYASPGLVQNPEVILTLFDNVPFYLILMGPLAVDIFFFLTGFLAVYLMLLEMHKKDGRAPNPVHLRSQAIMISS